MSIIVLLSLIHVVHFFLLWIIIYKSYKSGKLSQDTLILPKVETTKEIS